MTRHITCIITNTCMIYTRICGVIRLFTVATCPDLPSDAANITRYNTHMDTMDIHLQPPVIRKALLTDNDNGKRQTARTTGTDYRVQHIASRSYLRDPGGCPTAVSGYRFSAYWLRSMCSICSPKGASWMASWLSSRVQDVNSAAQRSRSCV